jgi:adenosine deaminase
VVQGLETFIKGLPKAELHVHIEGTLEPELLFDLAQRNGVALPYRSVEEVREAFSFDDLQSFLDLYYEGASVLLVEEDFHDLMAAYLKRAVDGGVRRAEIFFDPQTHTTRGIGFDVFMPGFLRAIDEAAEEISVALIMCFLRHLGPTEAVATFAEASAYHDRILGVGLDSTEIGMPPELFAEAFDLAGAAGLHRVAHAGEEGPAAYVSGALDVLGAERIDHGVRSEEDDAVVERLIAEGVPLTMCPLSNVALRGFERIEDHNLKRLMERGVRVTVNSDDPAYFGGYIADNYMAVAVGLGLTKPDLVRLARTSLEASFASSESTQAWLGELDAYVAAHAE